MNDTIKVIIESLPKHNLTFIDILNGIITPFIGVSVAYIARQQWKLGKEKFKYDLFEKRYKIYELINKLVSNLRQKDDPFCIKITENEIIGYLTKVDGYTFLFDKDVSNIIDDLNKKLEDYLHLMELCNSLNIKTVDKYFSTKERLPVSDPKVEYLCDEFNLRDLEEKEEFIREEFEKYEFEFSFLDYISDIEKYYSLFLKEVDKYINFRQIK
jgi:hypothetical protein